MRDIFRDRTCRTAIVTLKSGTAFRGVLYEKDRRALILRNAEAPGLGERGSTLLVDGEVLILLEDVDYIQII